MVVQITQSLKMFLLLWAVLNLFSQIISNIQKKFIWQRNLEKQSMMGQVQMILWNCMTLISLIACLQNVFQLEFLDWLSIDWACSPEPYCSKLTYQKTSSEDVGQLSPHCQTADFQNALWTERFSFPWKSSVDVI